jgi:ADP-ribose pyrophosphatase YjhB (NUDIX family)
MPEFVRRIPEGDTQERLVCAACDYVVYENPKVVVGSVVSDHDRVLLCRRAIPPRTGFWTLPAGYLELGETAEEGAVREAREEACAQIAVDGVLALFSIARIDQVQVIFRARFVDAAARSLLAPGRESIEVGLFDWEEIPWAEIAFPSVVWSLRAWRRVGDGPLGAPAGNPPEDPRGAAPFDANAAARL